jgi:hypothetical protein
MQESAPQRLGFGPGQGGVVCQEQGLCPGRRRACMTTVSQAVLMANWRLGKRFRPVSLPQRMRSSRWARAVAGVEERQLPSGCRWPGIGNASCRVPRTGPAERLVVQQPPHGRVRRDRAEQAGLIGQHGDIGYALRPVGDRDGPVGQDPGWIMDRLPPASPPPSATDSCPVNDVGRPDQPTGATRQGHDTPGHRRSPAASDER